jgi:polyhydroxybutyrate depolymerase
MRPLPGLGRACALWAVIIAASALLLNCGGASSTSASSNGGSSGTCNFQAGGNCTILVNGVTRTYLLHVPSKFQPNGSGLVIALHGGRGTGQQMQSVTHFNTKSDEVGFAVAYPDGLPNPSGATSWNGYFNFTYGANPPDDAGFLRQLILTLEANLHVNTKMVYVTGMSAGGYMTHRAGIDISDLVAAIGLVEGTLDVQQVGGTQVPPPAQGPVSVIILHGDADSVIPYCGLTNTNVTLTSEDQSFDYWWQTPAMSCSTPNPSGPLCTGFQGSPTSLFFKDAAGCHGGAEVRLYRLFNGTHTWYSSQLTPGNAVYNPDFNSTTGTTTDDILWNFFASHAKP